MLISEYSRIFKGAAGLLRYVFAIVTCHSFDFFVKESNPVGDRLFFMFVAVEMVSVSFQFYHTQMDGAHAARFLDGVQKEICSLSALF